MYNFNRREFIGAGVSSLLLPGDLAQAMTKQARRRIIQPYNSRKGSIYEGFIATRCGTLNNSTGGKWIMSRRGHVATSNIYALKMVLGNFYITAGSPNESVGGDGTYTASIEYPAGQFSQVLFGGRTSTTILAGNVGFSDYTRPVQMIPKGTQFWTLQWIANTVGNLCNDFNDNAAGDKFVASASALPDVTMGGAITNLTSNGVAPLALIGMTSAGSYLLEGDSIMRGFNDDATISDYRKGIVAKAFPADTYAFVNVASFALRVDDVFTRSAGRRQIYKYCSDCISERGVNDLMAGISVATITSGLQTIWAELRPGTRVQQLTLTPETSSAGSIWETDGDQTSVNVADEGRRVTFNTTLRAGSMAGTTSFFDSCTAWESSLNSGKIKGDGVTPQKYTNDGVHPNSAGYALQVYTPPAYP